MDFGEVKSRGRYERDVPVGEAPPGEFSAVAGCGVVDVAYLCDGGSSPNPGVTQPIVFDGARFLRIPAGAGGNHKAVYQAVEAALDDGFSRGAKRVRVYLFSRHVWGQLNRNVGADRLTVELSRTNRAAKRFASVEWVLVSPPVVALGATLRSRKAFRRLARRNPGGSSGIPPSPVSTAA